jgi:hypothetical protein
MFVSLNAFVGGFKRLEPVAKVRGERACAQQLEELHHLHIVAVHDPNYEFATLCG